MSFLRHGRSIGPMWAKPNRGAAAPLLIVRDESHRLSLGGVAVGMTIAGHPPHRSVLAELPHTAPLSDTSVKSNIGIWM